MAEKQIKENYLDFYLQNSDWEGRTVVDSFEKVNFQKDSSIRIWYNEQNHNYDKHWHNALEIIMPVENHYDVDASGQSYHLLPGEILIIPSGEMHALYAPETGKRFIFQFDVSGISQMKGYTSIQSLMTSCLHITKLSFPQIYGDIYQILIQIRNEYFSSNEFRELAIYSHLINLFVSIGRNHINDMEQLKEGVGLRGYANEDPLQAYIKEGYGIFDNMMDKISLETSQYLLKAEIRQNIERKEVAKPIINNREDGTLKGGTHKKEKIGRNDPCPCGSGRKYKMCCGK